jgi:hypothetical protein
MNNDPRRGLPSASALERLRLCPGSLRLSQQVEPLPAGTAATTGTAIHAALAGEDVDLEHSQETTHDACRRIEERLVRDHGFHDAPCEREQRRWYMDAELIERWSGQADAVFMRADGTRLIIDYKTGRGHVTAAERNMQMAALAVLWASHVNDTIVALVHPWVSPGYSVARYTPEDTWVVDLHLQGIIEEAQREDAPVRPHVNACRYCPATGRCAAAIRTLNIVPATQADVLEPDAIAALLDDLGVVEDQIDAIKARARQLATDGKLPGWALSPPSQVRTVSDVPALWQRWTAAGGDAEGFMSAITVKLSGLTKAVKTLTGAKGKDLDQRVDAMLDGVCETKEKAGRLVKS